VVPTYLLSRFTRKHVTVALGGDGGDEIFAGYPMYFGHRMARAFLRVPRVMRRGLIEPMVNLLPVKTKNLSFDYRAKRFITARIMTKSRGTTYGSDRSRRTIRMCCSLMK